MEIGTAPFKSLMQTGFMMWMSGSSVNIFSIMVTGMIIMNTLKSFFNIQTGRFVVVFPSAFCSLCCMLSSHLLIVLAHCYCFKC